VASRIGPARLACSRLLAGALLVAAVTGSAAGAEDAPRRVRSLTELRQQGVIRQHWDLSCGAAAIATLLTYQLGRPVTEREVALAMLRRTSPNLVRARMGFSLLDLKIYAATQGLGAAGYQEMTLADLDAMAPAIVPIRTHGNRHFVIYRGRKGDRVLLADPSFGNRTMPIWSFNAAWANGIGFTVFDPAQPQAPNRMGAPPELFLAPSLQQRREAVATIASGRL